MKTVVRQMALAAFAVVLTTTVAAAQQKLFNQASQHQASRRQVRGQSRFVAVDLE